MTRRRRWVWGLVAVVAVLAVGGAGLGWRLLTAPRPATHVTATIPVGQNPVQSVVAPDGTVYVPNRFEGTVSVISGGRVTATLPVGHDPSWPGVAPDGTVYVPNRFEGTVSVIAGGRVTATLPVGHDPSWPVVAPCTSPTAVMGRCR